MQTLPFIYFLWLYIKQGRRYSFLSVGNAVLLIYLVSSLFSIPLYNYPRFSNVEIGIIPTFLYCALITLCLTPLWKFNSDSIKIIENVEKKSFLRVGWFFIIVSLIAFAIDFNEIREALFSDLGKLRDMFYNDAYDNVIGGMVWYKYILSLVVPFSPIMLLMFFYSISKMSNGIIFNCLLIVASLVMVGQSFLNASRTQVIYWILTVYILYILFRKHLSLKANTAFFVLGSVFGTLLIGYIFLVTVSRFGEGADAESSLLTYIGSPFLSFCEVYDHYYFGGELTFDRVFPILTKYVFRNDFNLTVFREMESVRIHTPVNVFFTFLGDALIDFGKLGMVIYAILLYILSNICLRRKNQEKITFSQLILFVLIVRQLLLGLFAYVYLTITSSILILGSLSICILFNRKNTYYE